jgi:hypothetical protein
MSITPMRQSAVMRKTLLIIAVLVASAAPARAQRPPEPLYTPSAFSYGFHGFLLGASAGVGAGYLVARSGGWHDGDWRALAYGAGIGALVGGGLGIGLGIADMANETPGRGYFILRDGGMGMGFGAVTGAIAGGLVALSTKKGEHILFGASVGALAGTAFGVVLGLVEGQRYRGRMALSLATAAAADGSIQLLPALVGRY